jgi:hypothetical protein
MALPRGVGWKYFGEAENRLVRMVAATLDGPQQRIEFTDDPPGRHIRKQRRGNVAGTVLALDVKFLYEGWNLLAELNAMNQ